MDMIGIRRSGILAGPENVSPYLKTPSLLVDQFLALES